MPAAPASSAALVLGPVLRYVDTSTATIWVQTAEAVRVTVRAEDGSGREWSADTFRVHRHHYALVVCAGLAPGTCTPYAVDVDGAPAWPPMVTEPALPPPAIATLATGGPTRLAYGSCRTSVPHDEDGNRTHGVDALRAWALALAGVTESESRPEPPALLVLLGDQVYADETTEEMREFIAARRDLDQPPGAELADYTEYAELYRIAWSEPVQRWLLSTVPSAMIFDDHDVRDDWNTSEAWRRKMRATDWWQGRIVAALASYWVYQHLGNLSPAELEKDEIWRLAALHTGEGEPDLTAALEAFAARVDAEPETYRWSFARELGGTRLVVVDSRAARVLGRADRAMLDDAEADWFDRQLRGGVDHLLIGTSLPFLLPDGLHHLEAANEAVAEGAWGTRAARAAEWLRQTFDLEHWAAFQRSFQAVTRAVTEVAAGRRGPKPTTITFLSGDVHHSYVSQVRTPPGVTPVVQAVCSPIRNPLPRRLRFATAASAYGLAGPVGWVTSSLARVPPAAWRWRRVRGPWFDNTMGELVASPTGLRLRWSTGVVQDGRHDLPALEQVAEVEVPADPTRGAGT